jgi:hypothetical protein
MVSAAVLAGLDAGGPHWFGIGTATWIAGAGALACFVAAWPRRK